MPVKDPGAAGIELTVKDGEWVGSLAPQYGHLVWDASVWGHERNRALREKRGDPHLLSPGDKLFIPARGKKESPCASNAKHRFRQSRTPETIRLRLLGADGRPRAEVAYQLTVEFSDSGEKFQQRGTATDPDGVLEERIPCSTTSAKLKLTATGDELELRVGRLEPVDPADATKRRKAAQQRLAALGFYQGATDGAESPELTASLRAFQQFCRDQTARGASAPDAGEPDGALDDELMAALREHYGC